jgi:cytochrome c biogenesis protein CcmG/thiol:disulfide interchange protein DsbE
MKQATATAVMVTLAALMAATDSFADPKAKEKPPQPHTAYYGSETASAAKVPSVALSMQEDAFCKLKVGQKMPAIELPKLDGGSNAKLFSLLGKKATVVIFWKGDNRMTSEELTDLGPDVIERFGKQGVEVVGIAVEAKSDSAKEAVNKVGAKFTILIDADGKAFTQVGKEKLPRTFVLDADGKIVWFDISYTLATRRELHDTLQVLTGDGKQK